MRGLSWLGHVLKDYPRAGNAVTSGAIFLFGDTMAQAVERTQQARLGGDCGDDSASRPCARRELSVLAFFREDWDARRAGTMVLWGSVTAVWPMLFWFRALDARFPGRAGLGFVRRAVPAMQKTLANQLLMAPAMNTLFFLYVSTWKKVFAEERSPSVGSIFAHKMQAEFVKTTALSLTFWTPAQFINFCLVPPQFRVIYVNFGLALWTTYLSFVSHR